MGFGCIFSFFSWIFYLNCLESNFCSEEIFDAEELFDAEQSEEEQQKQMVDSQK